MFKPEGYVRPVDRMEELFFAKERGFPVEARVEKVTWIDGKPVWGVDLKGAIGLVPSSETGLGDSSLMPRFTGQTINVIIKGIDKDAGIVACSRREAVASAMGRFFEVVKEGTDLPAVIKAILPRDPLNGTPERIVVDVGGGILTEVTRRDATKSQVDRLGELYPVGTPVHIKVLQADKQSGTIRVALANETDPWQKFDVKRGDFLAGKVLHQTNGIVFLEIKPGIKGIAQAPLRGRLFKGDTLPVVVTTFDREAKKLRLKIRGAKLAR